MAPMGISLDFFGKNYLGKTSPTEGWSGWQLPLLPKLRALVGGSTSTESLRHWAQSCGSYEGWVLNDIQINKL